MNRRNIIGGAALTYFAGSLWMREMVLFVERERVAIPIFNLDGEWAKYISIAGGLMYLILLILGTIDYAKDKPKIDKTYNFTISIPIQFFLPLTLMLWGGSIFMLNEIILGTSLSCLSVPALGILLLITFRKINKEEGSIP